MSRTINGVPIPDGVIGIAPPHVAAVAKACADAGVPFLFVGGVAEIVKTDQEVEQELREKMTTPMTAEDRKKLADIEAKGYDEAFVEFYTACKEQKWDEVK